MVSGATSGRGRVARARRADGVRGGLQDRPALVVGQGGPWPCVRRPARRPPGQEARLQEAGEGSRARPWAEPEEIPPAGVTRWRPGGGRRPRTGRRGGAALVAVAAGAAGRRRGAGAGVGSAAVEERAALQVSGSVMSTPLDARGATGAVTYVGSGTGTGSQLSPRAGPRSRCWSTHSAWSVCSTRARRSASCGGDRGGRRGGRVGLRFGRRGGAAALAQLGGRRLGAAPVHHVHEAAPLLDPQVDDVRAEEQGGDGRHPQEGDAADGRDDRAEGEGEEEDDRGAAAAGEDLAAAGALGGAPFRSGPRGRGLRVGSAVREFQARLRPGRGRGEGRTSTESRCSVAASGSTSGVGPCAVRSRSFSSLA